MNIGIDFGSTYSVVSKYNQTTDNVEPIPLHEGEPATIPTVVSVNTKKGQITTGAGAKNQAGKKTVRIFEGFKILLTETNAEMLKKRGYDEKYTPREVTKLFLESVLKGVKEREKLDKIENLVVCVPEIWGRSNLMQHDGRVILRDILSGDISTKVEHVRVVTEPEAASAFFAYHYQKETGRSFNGHLLLIDYGGGTLDITLTEVCSDGRGGMEIIYRESGGAGENHPDRNGNGSIGSAGMAFMQTVVTNALREAGLLGENEFPVYTSPDYIKAVQDLECQLKSVERIRDIEDAFSVYGSYSDMKNILNDDDDEDAFLSLEYGEEELSVSFRQIFRAYQETIEGVLRSQILSINKKVREHIGADPCRLDGWGRKDFKIALVGGFGSFYLVKAQLAEIYNLDVNEQNDPRTKNISAEKKEQAIALGAALLAAGKVFLKKTARYSIGLCTKDRNGQPKTLFYGIKYHQNIEPGKPYFILSKDAVSDSPDQRQVWAALYGNIESFAVEFSDDLKRGGIMDLKQEMLNRLRELPRDGFWYCGFSMDENDIVSFHVVPREEGRNRREIVIPLDSYMRMFNLAALREVTLP